MNGGFSVNKSEDSDNEREEDNADVNSTDNGEDQEDFSSYRASNRHKIGRAGSVKKAK